MNLNRGDLMNNNLICDNFQSKVSDVLVRHKSILDIISKLEESNSRVNRAVVKSATSCGCISINASKQEYNKETLQEVKNHLKTHVEGELCESCKEKIEEEIGNHMFYIASLCNTLGLSLNEIIEKELKELKTLGIYRLL
jgi:predicted house-cleaning noncanonical NTP pyrophosphatase (MazG superfamily)